MGKNKGKKKNKGPEGGGGDAASTSQQQQPQQQQQEQQQQQQQQEEKKKEAEKHAGGDDKGQQPRKPHQQPQQTEDFPQLSQYPSQGRKGKKKQRQEQGEGDAKSVQEQPPQKFPQSEQPHQQRQPEQLPQQSQRQSQQRQPEQAAQQRQLQQPAQQRQPQQSAQQARRQPQQPAQQYQPQQPAQQAWRQPQQRQPEQPPQQRQPDPPSQQAWQRSQQPSQDRSQEQKGRGRGSLPQQGFQAGRGRPPPGFQPTTQRGQETVPTPRGAWSQQQQTQMREQETRKQGIPPKETTQRPADISQASPVRGQAPQQVSAPQRTSPPASRGPGGDASVKHITERMSSLMEVALIPKRREGRPPKENRGKSIILETNHLSLGMKNPRAIVYHYDVSVTPDRPFKFYRPALKKMQERFYPNQHPAFDGKKNIYSYGRLPVGDYEVLEGVVSVWDDGRETTREVTVKIKFANAVDFSTISDYLRAGTSTNTPQEAIQALDIVLRNPAATNGRFVPVGRSYFSSPKGGQVVQLGEGLVLWYGFYQSAILGWKPFLNIDVAHKGFPTADNCLDHLCDFLRVQRGRLDPNSRPDRRGLENFESFIKGLRIVYEIKRGGVVIRRTHKVLSLSRCPRENRFTHNGQEITVEEYYLREYNYRINYPLVNCLEYGTQANPRSLPMELCRVVEGQARNKKLSDMQTRNMVRAAAVPPPLRRQRIEGSIREIAFDNDPCIKEFGITVTTQFTKVDARILDPPQLLYQNNRKINVEKGVWKSETFIRSNPLKKWAILSTDRYASMPKMQELIKCLISNGRQLGMDIANPLYVTSIQGPRDIEQYLKNWRKESIELAIIILPDRGMVTYGRVKQIAEQQIGILTQCLKTKTLDKLSPATVTNILLKINSKHNGINHNVTCEIWSKYFSRPVIVFGADVTHPSPGQEGVPSVAAVAASYEPRAFSYNMMWRFQEPREEMIRDLQEIVSKQLMEFYKHNGKMKPERIFFYRDGVSEGQFKQVLDIELQAIRRACKSLGPDYEPPITFLVVQKRHHTRFFPRQQDADGKTRNVPAGTVVDTTITHANEIDFYLVSHASIQGTSRPTKYHVLWDDSNMSEDDLEEITYYLCHLFTRCTRAVSYPAPTYYAHLAAFRIRSYYEGRGVELNSLRTEQERHRVNADLLLRSPMYFV